MPFKRPALTRNAQSAIEYIANSCHSSRPLDGFKTKVQLDVRGTVLVVSFIPVFKTVSSHLSR